MRAVRVGCSGWNDRHWKEPFYRDGRPGSGSALRGALRQGRGERDLLPAATVKGVQGWVDQTPDGFLFSVKASRYLTHIRRLRDLGDGIARFYERLEPLVASPKLGPVLWQLPESFHRDDERLDTALAAFPSGRHCVEFRHESWFQPDVYSILRHNRAALVIGDAPNRPFQTRELTTAWTYVRFHHGSRGRNGNYSDGELDEWWRRIAGWRTRVEVFAYFSNDWAMASSERNFRRYTRFAHAF